MTPLRRKMDDAMPVGGSAERTQGSSLAAPARVATVAGSPPDQLAPEEGVGAPRRRAGWISVRPLHRRQASPWPRPASRSSGSARSRTCGAWISAPSASASGLCASGAVEEGNPPEAQAGVRTFRQADPPLRRS